MLLSRDLRNEALPITLMITNDQVAMILLIEFVRIQNALVIEKNTTKLGHHDSAKYMFHRHPCPLSVKPGLKAYRTSRIVIFVNRTM